MLQLKTPPHVRPLDEVHVTSETPGRIRVFDASGLLYHQADGSQASFRASGALGTHVVSLHNQAGAEIERATFSIDCKTEIEDAGGRFKKMLYMLHATFASFFGKPKTRVFDGERVYHLHILTSRDTIHAIKGAAYFYDWLRDVIDLFGKYQREDGMVWDFAQNVTPGFPRHMEWRFKPEFTRRVNDGKVLFARQPVMNDLEHMFIGGIHLIWKFTGDDAWMESKLDNALAAMRFARTSPYTWSEKYQLIKRPYCLDLWDFQSKYDSDLIGGDDMNAVPGKTVYGIFHGDNTGMIDACRKLGDMLEYVGRKDEAAEAKDFAKGLQNRLDEIAWNGEFYTHHVSEDPSFKRDFGVDESTQVSLSNAYAVNRGIGHEKVKAIIETYLRIRREMPEQSPAEWFQMYPPFQKGWQVEPGVYTNGAVTILVAGELAHGAFEHGYEDYAADILKRTLDVFEPYGETFIGGLNGFGSEPPERTLEPLDLRPVANTDLVCTSDHDGWAGQPGNDMRELPTGKQTFESVDFDIIEPASNGGRAAIRLAEQRPGWAESVSIPVAKNFRSLYLLHASSGGGPVAGELILHYQDGTRDARYIATGKDVLPFWNPHVPESMERQRSNAARVKLAWRGKNESIWNIGLTALGVDNPQPDKTVERIELRAGHGNARWFVVGVTLSDGPVYLSPMPFGGGAPPNWSAGALMYALAEGLAGVKDEATNLRALRLAPRWLAAGVDEVTACIRYAQAGGYARYRYRRQGDTMYLDLAANAARRRVELLLPADRDVEKIVVNGRKSDYTLRTIESSRYACLELAGPAAVSIQVQLKS